MNLVCLSTISALNLITKIPEHPLSSRAIYGLALRLLKQSEISTRRIPLTSIFTALLDEFFTISPRSESPPAEDYPIVEKRRYLYPSR